MATKVVVTGRGLITPLGAGLAANIDALKAGVSGVSIYDRFVETQQESRMPVSTASRSKKGASVGCIAKRHKFLASKRYERRKTNAVSAHASSSGGVRKERRIRSPFFSFCVMGSESTASAASTTRFAPRRLAQRASPRVRQTTVSHRERMAQTRPSPSWERGPKPEESRQTRHPRQSARRRKKR